MCSLELGCEEELCRRAGGFEYDGGQEISALDPEAVRKALRESLAAGARSLVLCGVFSPVNAAHELAASAIIDDELKAINAGELVFPLRILHAFLLLKLQMQDRGCRALFTLERMSSTRRRFHW